MVDSRRVPGIGGNMSGPSETHVVFCDGDATLMLLLSEPLVNSHIDNRFRWSNSTEKLMPSDGIEEMSSSQSEDES